MKHLQTELTISIQVRIWVLAQDMYHKLWTIVNYANYSKIHLKQNQLQSKALFRGNYFL